MSVNSEIGDIISQLHQIQNDFENEFGISDIYSNSKLYEIMIANELNHTPIAGHSGTRNGKTKDGEFEYKHYKESSKNHTWTFNDYTKTTLGKLCSVKSVIFAHIDDADKRNPKFDWYVEVPGKICSNYLEIASKRSKNKRRMLNVSECQIEKNCKIKRTEVIPNLEGRFTEYLEKIFSFTHKLGKATMVSQIMTSNKLWEILVAREMSHQVLSEQLGHDAKDEDGKFYEYKVSARASWSFQDITESVLKKYLNDEKIVLAVVDKKRIKLKEIHIAEPEKVVNRLKNKLVAKKEKYKKEDKEIRRISATISKGDLSKIDAKKIFPH